MRLLLLLSPILFVGLISGCSGGVAVPTEFEYIGSIDKFVWMEAPVGWDNEVLDKRNLSIETKKGSASCRISQGTLPNIVGDLSSGGVMLSEGDGVDSPEARAHEYMKQFVEDEYSGFKERGGEFIKTRMGRIWTTEFIGSGKQGYRGTMIRGGNTLLFRFQCAKGQWTKMKPVFQRILQSVGAEPAKQ